jgi:hypothetical protein
MASSSTSAPSSSLAGARERTRLALRSAMSAEWASVRRCAKRLAGVLPDHSALHRNTVLVAYGGGKDSAYTMAFARAMQLELFHARGTTFRLRGATNRHAGMPEAVMKNIHRTYTALGVYEDPLCEQLIVDGNMVREFQALLPQPEWLVERNRLDILMAGHRTYGDGRPTFCNACNLSVANAFGLAASYEDGVDIIITGDSPAEQRTYVAWIRQLASRLGVLKPDQSIRSFADVLRVVDDIGKVYFDDVYGGLRMEGPQGREMLEKRTRLLKFFSVYDDTGYAAGDHWDLLTGFLGFIFDVVAFSFTESDCANPALMAHLRGLKAERLYKRSYADGVAEYVAFAASLMRHKEIPPHLIDMILARYCGEDAVTNMRQIMDDFATRTFSLREEMLVCMVYSPFAGQARRLEPFLQHEHPDLACASEQIRALLAAGGAQHAGAGGRLIDALNDISGLPLKHLRTLYTRPLRSITGADGGKDIFAEILAGDPHTAIIATRHAPGGPSVHEHISGR